MARFNTFLNLKFVKSAERQIMFNSTEKICRQVLFLFQLQSLTEEKKLGYIIRYRTSYCKSSKEGKINTRANNIKVGSARNVQLSPFD